MSRDEIRRFFGQARFAYDSTTSTAPDLRRSLKIRVDEAKVEDPQFIEVEVELARIYESLGTKIQALKDNGQIDAAVAIPLSHASKASTIFHGEFVPWHITPQCRLVADLTQIWLSSMASKKILPN
jgi:hypothetical protein